MRRVRGGAGGQKAARLAQAKAEVARMSAAHETLGRERDGLEREVGSLRERAERAEAGEREEREAKAKAEAEVLEKDGVISLFKSQLSA